MSEADDFAPGGAYDETSNPLSDHAGDNPFAVESHSRVWFSPHGTEWEAETYEEALEKERDSLVEQLEALREAVYQAESVGTVNEVRRILSDALKRRTEPVRK